jgi:putative endonuclease
LGNNFSRKDCDPVARPAIHGAAESRRRDTGALAEDHLAGQIGNPCGGSRPAFMVAFDAQASAVPASAPPDPIRQACSIKWRIQLSMAEAWVYMLRCADGSLYTGWTVDVQRRLTRHRAGAASRYTASRLPVELAWAQEMPDRGAARREEVLIKKLGRGEKLALVAAGDWPEEMS